ncbi:MAG: hypothetical protein EA339_12330 [Rhodobacteraceae bacterium]|nr:MAG: hypothetical protein EA339_12330 [Paracoccaceae bacterium]
MINSGSKKRPTARASLYDLFRRDEDGGIIIFGLLAFIIILMVGGIAVDMMRYESERVRLQGTADRAVLAAAVIRDNPDNPDPEDLVRSYFEAEGLGKYIDREGAITVTGPDDSRTVLVQPRANFNTTFMRLSNVNNLQMNLGAGATESLAEVRFEIVMVLDVSYSMFSNERIQNLRAAATEFVEMMLPEGEDLEDRIAITIVPYSTEVIMPANTLGYFTNLANPPSGSMVDAFCIDFAEWDTVTNSINTPMWRRNCATGEGTANEREPDFKSLREMPIRPYLRSRSEAIAYINTLAPSFGTSIDLGVRAGALFLDPSINPIIEHQIDSGNVDSVFRNRPLAWDEPFTFRAIILMTDGENCCFEEDSPGRRKATVEIQDADTVAVCNALKAQNVTIYSVAFEAPPRGVALMESCASAPSFFFNSSGEQLIAAFRNIATHIQTQTLRLTQ